MSSNPPAPVPRTMSPARQRTRKIWSLCFRLPAAIFLLASTFTTVFYLLDPALRNGEIPRLALVLHERLAPGIAKWARERIASGNAEQVAMQDVAGTEWPLFGSMFYLRAIEALEEEWKRNPGRFSEEPAVYARAAIDASRDLVIDPGHAHWVKQHWGDDYLRKEDVFYRMLLISAITSHHRLTGDRSKLDFLQDQVNSLAQELDASPFGLLDDYPGECYPADVIAAVAAIRAADDVLGTDHSAWAERQKRCVTADKLTLGLPAYFANSRTGQSHDSARGCTTSFVTLFAMNAWPDLTNDWYARLTEDFWQKNVGFEGFREFPTGKGPQWFMDPDSGPVLAGFGFSTCANGLGSARAHGRMDQAWPLATEALALSLPLPGGHLIVPRLLSNGAQSPYLGESLVLYHLTRTPQGPVVPVKTWAPPLAVWVILAGGALIGGALLGAELRFWRKLARQTSSR